MMMVMVKVMVVKVKVVLTGDALGVAMAFALVCHDCRRHLTSHCSLSLLVTETDDLTLDVSALVDSSSKPSNASLVPSTLFFRIPAHVAHLRNVVKDLEAGHRFILLIGNQGTGALLWTHWFTSSCVL